MADMDFSQAFTYSDINKVYLMAVELSGGLVSQHGSVQLERIFQDSTLYAQVSALKNEMESILQNFTGASEYDDTATYAVGDYCTKDDYLYQCNTAVSAESWDASKWDVVTISSQYTMLKNILGVDDYSTSASYAVGDFVVHGGKMYRCTTAVSGGAWDASKWSETDFVAEVESAIAEIQNEGATQIANVQAVYADDMAEVNAKVSRNTKEIANLIQKEGVVSISYPDSIYGRGEVPSGMAKFAEVSCLRGVTRVGNQLIPIFSVESQTVNGVTWTNNGDGSYTANGTATANSTIILQTLSVPSDAIKKDHVYLLNTGYTDSTGNSFRTELVSRTSGNQNVLYVDCFAPSIVTPTDSGLNLYVELRVMNGKTANNLVFRPTLTDLTLYFGGNIPSDAQTIADIQQNYPELLVPSDYDTGTIVSTTYSAVKSVGKNLISGFQVGKDWALLSNPERACFRLDNPSYIGKAMVLSATWPSTVNTIRVVRIRDANVRPNSFTYEEPISIEIVGNVTMTQAIVDECKAQLELGSTATEYTPYMTDTLTLPSPVTLRSAGSVADTCEPNVEVDGVAKKRTTERVGKKKYSDLSWSYGNNGGRWNENKFYAPIDGKDASNGDFATIYAPTAEAMGAMPNKSARMFNGNTYIYIRDDSYNSVEAFLLDKGNAEINYKLADPVVTLTDPIYDNFVLTEAGGTITPRQTQSKQIDTSFDVNYLAV